MTVETERDHAKRRLQELERGVGFGGFANHISLESYLREFMSSHQIDAPVVSLHGEQIPEGGYPSGYMKFQREWELRKAEDERRDDRIIESEDEPTEEPQSNPQSADAYIMDFDKLVEDLIRKS